MSVGISREEWLAELERCLAAAPPGADGMTAREIAAALKCSTDRVYKMLDGMGESVVVAYGWRENRAGQAIKVPVYAPRKAPRRGK